MPRILLLSSTAQHGYNEILDWCESIVKDFLGPSIKRILFVPYALKDHDSYTNKIRKRMDRMGLAVDGIHQSEDPCAAVSKAEAIFIGGGNTFRLLTQLYNHKLVSIIRTRVTQDSLPYMGSSAGSNVATSSICTTNDMPIMYPPTFNALALVPFNINPHYIDTDPDSKHKGETREKRIMEYLECCPESKVVGLREGSGLLLDSDGSLRLVGSCKARLFVSGQEPVEYTVTDDLTFLMHTPTN